MILHAGSNSVFVHWGLSADDRDVARTKSELDGMISSFSEFKDKKLGYTKFHDFLMSMWNLDGKAKTSLDWKNIKFLSTPIQIFETIYSKENRTEWGF